jgi:hypothetical protein
MKYEQWLHQGEEEALSVIDDHHNLDIDIVFCVDWSTARWLREILLSNDRWKHGI